uniref:RanBP2-type domain-containing protein n=1 Tax=Laticauda laticaudata TaxID=8630 RepID=A0A8C5SXP9_LATLA
PVECPANWLGLLKGKKNMAELPIPLQFQVYLRLISTAFQILEKYGRNLLHPRKPYFWRMVKFNNPVFRDTVDTIQGGRDVLRLYGYSEQKLDGLYFPDSQSEPDIPQVASVTVDVMLLRAELTLVLSETHPNPQVLTNLRKLLFLSLPPSLCLSLSLFFFFLRPAGNLPPDTCLLCGLEVPSQHCAACNQSLCPNCDWLFHKHPSRTHHHRLSVHCIPSETTSLRAPSLPPLSSSHIIPSQRPPWRCTACQKNNDASCILCINCDRPRGCKTPQNLGLDDELTSQGQLARGRWSCQTCTFENESATVLCAVCERPYPLVLILRPELSPPPATYLFPQDPSWQCDHCTFRNSVGRRICEMCNCTSLHGDTQPPLAREEKEEVGRMKRGVVEAPGEPQGLWRAPSITPEEVEHQRQEKLRDDGQKMVDMIREAETVGVAPEMVAAALCYSGAELPLAWLKSELPCVLEGMAELATQRGDMEPDGGLGAITLQEVQTAWMASRGDVDDAISRCLSARRSKVSLDKMHGKIVFFSLEKKESFSMWAMSCPCSPLPYPWSILCPCWVHTLLFYTVSLVLVGSCSWVAPPSYLWIRMFMGIVSRDVSSSEANCRGEKPDKKGYNPLTEQIPNKRFPSLAKQSKQLP